MNKKLAVTLVAMAIAASAGAVRAIHKLFPMKQSDGTTVMLYKVGDGHLAFYTTPDNQVVVSNADGTLCYAELKDGVLVSTDIPVHDMEYRTASENAFVAANTLKPTDAALVTMAAPQRTENGPLRAYYPTSADGLGEYGVSALGALPSVGSPTVPVLMVEFSDKKFSDGVDVAKYTRFMNEEGYHEDSELQRGSMKDYYRTLSRGLFNPTFDVAAKVTLENSYKYYGENNTPGEKQTGDKRARVLQMLKEAIAAAVGQGVDFSKYVVNGKVPNIILIYAGCGEATSDDSYTIWPHESELTWYNNSYSGYLFGSYFVGNELNGSEPYTRMMGMGVMIHELGHALGLPDFYCTDYNYGNDSPLGEWSVMDSGPYVNDSYAPVGFSAYERSCLGWLDIPELKDAQAVKLTPASSTEGDMAVLLRNPDDNNEYFILENRQPDTWYPTSAGSGLLVTRVAYNRNSWSANTLNNTQKYKRVMVVSATDRVLYSDARESDLYGNGVNNITSFNLYNGSKLTDKPVYKIIKQPDGVITFNYKDRNLDNDYAVVNDETYEKVTDASTLKADDKVIFVCEADKVAMTPALSSGNRSIVSVKIEDGKVYGNDNIAKYSIVIPASGTGYAFKVDGSNAFIGASSSGFRNYTKGDAACIANITITDGNASVVFGGNSARKTISYSMDNTCFSCYTKVQSDIQIYRLTSSAGINKVLYTPMNNAGGKMFNLAGQQVGDGYKGIVIMNGKKILKK